MQKVLTAEEMREVDRLTTEKYGIPSIILMENAAHAAARVITGKLGGSVKGKSFLILCGKGNNGGDGAALARILMNCGGIVTLYLWGTTNNSSGDAKINFEISSKIGADYQSQGMLFFFEIDEGHEIDFTKYDCVIDAFFGTGLKKQLEGKAKNVLETVRAFRSHIANPLLVSIDIPSGLNADKSGLIGENFQTDLTITFTAPKLANVFPPASNFNGELIVANIGSPQELIDNSPSKLFVAEKSDVKDWLEITKIKSNFYKKTRGTSLIIAGSKNYSGAAVLSANACFASGCGMVTVVVPSEIHQIVASKTLDEIIVTTNSMIGLNYQVVAAGCGMKIEEKEIPIFCETVKNRQTPMVLDAEALNALSPFNLQGSDEFPLILTPHIGEFRRLLGREVRDDKIVEVREFAAKHNVILVLKSERSLIGNPDGTVVINPTGTAGISRAGAGDTLTGIITSFLAQTFAIRENVFGEKSNIEKATLTVIAALYIAGLAGEIAAEKFSERLMTATDVRNCLQEAISRIDERENDIRKF